MTGHSGGGRLLAMLRQQARLTQSELAEQAGISRSMVAQIEIGERRPSRKVLAALTRVLAIPSTDESELLAHYDFLPTGQTTEQIEALLRADKNLTGEQVEQIAALVREAYLRAVGDLE